MLRNIFIPEKVGSYYVFPKRIVGIDIGKSHVLATQLLLKGTTATLEKHLSIPLEAGNHTNYEERAITALKEALQQVDSYHELRTCLPSSVAIFKELKLPFLSYNKIKMVIEFEVEPLLPFPIQDAVVDFIITRQSAEEKSSDVLIAAVQKQHIAQHLHLFAQAGANPHVITIDFFALYGLYKLIPYYASLPGGTALIDIGSHSTTIAYINNGQLRLIRSLPKGTLALAKTISTELHLQPIEAMDHVLRFGLAPDAEQRYLKTAQPAFAAFCKDISFTLNSFSSQIEQQQINTVLILGAGNDIKGLAPFMASTLGIPTEPFNITKLLQQDSLSIITKNGIPTANTMSLSVALPSSTSDFNLRKNEFSMRADNALFIKQLIAATALVLILLFSLTFHVFFQLSSLNSAVHEGEQEVATALKEHFKKIPATEENLDAIIAQASSEIKKEEKLWFAFANPNRTSLLTYLLELTNRINKEELGFSIDRLHITENTMTITAHVKDHKALDTLEKELEQSELFSQVEKQDNPDFTMRIRLVQ